jgi:ribosomal protein S18 acetylase RimI-like enzyme
MEVRPLQPGEWRTYRAIRLRALADAPDAFGTTLAQANARPDESWQDQADGFAADEYGTLFLALDGREPCGLCAVALDANAPERAGIYQMWVAPEARGTGLGRRLLDEAARWARERGAGTLHLSVTEGNGPAIRLYESAGFRFTGESEPLRPGSEQRTLAMVRELA